MHTKTSQLQLNWPSLLVFVRHGESEGNKYGRRYMAQVKKKPSYLFGLTELGITQAKQAGEHLHTLFDLTSFDAYFTSTYTRAQETFAHIFKDKKKNGHQIEPLIDARINEISRGYGSIVSEEWMAEKHPKEIETLQLNGWFHNIPLAGQSCVQIEHIIHSFLAFLRETCANKKVIVVGHGTWINLCCRILTNRSIAESERLHGQEFYINCGATVFAKNKETGVMELVEENIKTWK